MKSLIENFKFRLLATLMITLGVMQSCTEEEPTDGTNVPPTIAVNLDDLQLDAGFGSRTVDISQVFDDSDGDELSFVLNSSNEQVITASLSGTTVTLTEVGTGSSTITVTADDGKDGTVSDSFMVSVNAAGNTLPTVVSPLSDLSLDEGFGTQNVDLPPSFSDAETQMLMFQASSSDEDVVTTTIDRGTLTLTEVGIGSAVITVTALDEDGGSVSDEFTVTINEGLVADCANDNSVFFDSGTCDETSSISNSYQETVNGDVRTIVTNGIPNHDFSNQNPTADELNSETKTITLDATPSLADQVTAITDGGRPVWRVGVALNGVYIDPAPAEPFIFTNSNTGEYNWDWVFEPNSNKDEVGLDCATAHVQPDGTYHYHGDMIAYADVLISGLGSGTTTPQEPVQIGWAADGFPIFYKYGYDAAGNFKEMESSYSIRSGERSGDGITAPCGEYNGKYTNDYEFVAGSGDLDECNGISQRITIGNDSFDYYYVITEDFPVVSRCISGTPSDSFQLGGGGMGGGGMGMP